MNIKLVLAAVAVGILLSIGSCWIIVDTGRADRCYKVNQEDGDLVWTSIVVPPGNTIPIVHVQDAKSIAP